MIPGEAVEGRGVLGNMAIGPTGEDEQALAISLRRRSTWARLRRQRVAMAGLIVIVLFVLAAALAPWLAGHPPNLEYDTGLSAVGAPLGGSAHFPLGTDTLGRDVLSRLLFGARISLTVGLLATALMLGVGVTLGAIAGFFGGWSEVAIMRLLDIMLALPVVLLGMAAASVFSPSVLTTIIVITVTQWMYVARVVYNMILSLKEWEFVLAARALGVGDWRIIRRHIVPHLVPVVIAYGALGVGNTILLEASLSFLNAGVPPPTASWGAMISGGLSYYREDPQLVLYPGLALIVVVMAFNLLGDGLTRALEAR